MATHIVLEGHDTAVRFELTCVGMDHDVPSNVTAPPAESTAAQNVLLWQLIPVSGFGSTAEAADQVGPVLIMTLPERSASAQNDGVHEIDDG